MCERPEETADEFLRYFYVQTFAGDVSVKAEKCLTHEQKVSFLSDRGEFRCREYSRCGQCSRWASLLRRMTFRRRDSLSISDMRDKI